MRNLFVSEPKVLLIHDVVRITRLSRRTIDGYIKDRNFPQPFKLGNKNAWFETAIVNWLFEQSEKSEGGAA